MFVVDDSDTLDLVPGRLECLTAFLWRRLQAGRTGSPLGSLRAGGRAGIGARFLAGRDDFDYLHVTVVVLCCAGRVQNV